MTLARLATPTLLLFSTAAALGLGELAIRGLGRAPGVKPIALDGNDTVYQRSTNPILGFELKASYRNERADLMKSYPSTNSHGQRDVERAIDKPSGVKRIILLGDSVVEGVGIRDLDDLMSRRLEMLYPGGGTEVLNFGVGAYCTLAEVELLEVKGMAFRPDVVVLMFVENDFLNFNREAHALGSAVHRPRVVEMLFLHSHLFRLLSIELNLFHFGIESDPLRWNRNAIGDNNVVEGLQRLADLARRHRFDPVITIWPTFTDAKIVDSDFMPSEGDELVIERLARMDGIPAARLSPYFRAQRASIGHPVNPRLRYTVDGDAMHPNREAVGIAARALKSILADLEASGQIGAGPPGALRGRARDPEAVEAARALGAAEPTYARVHYNLGQQAQARGKIDEAIQHYREALQADPAYALAHYNLGVALQSKGELEPAIRHYRLALRAEPAYAKAHNNIAVILEEQGNPDGAVHHYRQAYHLAPDHDTMRKNFESAVKRQTEREARP